MSKKTVNRETNLQSLYGELHKFGQNSEYEKALKIANKILNIAPDEIKAAHCKVISLIQSSKFSEAIQFIERTKLNHLIFEKAYAEYRLNQPEKALETIDKSITDGTALPFNLKELRAQILYRLEQFDDCFDSYRDLIKNSNDDYENERATNLNAVATNLAIMNSQREIPNIGGGDDDTTTTYELCYNGACILAGKQKYMEAEKKLRTSEKMCREFLEEDGANEEDIQEEMAIIRVQLAYCLQMQGKLKEAAVIYGDILKHKTNDVALTAVASNNTVVINKDQNVFDSKKKIRAAMADACEHKLTLKQKKVIALNNCLLAFYANQMDQCQQFTKKFIEQYPDMEFCGTLIRVCQLIKDKKFKEAIDLLEKYSQKENVSDKLETKFAIIQLLLLNNNKKEAIERFQSLGEFKYRPGVVSAVVSLLLGTDNKLAAANVLQDAVEWYKRSKVNSGDLTDMWRQAANFHLRGGKAEIAASSLEELFKANPKDMKILAQLVIAYAQFDPKKAQDYSKKLPALDKLTNATEIDNLEATNWMMSTKAVRKTTAGKVDASPGTPGGEIAAAALRQRKKRQRKRKGKLPKNYNPDVAPDPERWLPKYERTGYRRKRDRRTKEVIKGSQGMATGAADQYDMSKAQNLSKTSPAVQTSSHHHTESTPGPRQHQRKNHQKKRKGRF